MRRPVGGWKRQRSPAKKKMTDIAIIFLLFGGLGLFTSFVFDINRDKETYVGRVESGRILFQNPPKITVKNRREVYEIVIRARGIPLQAWTFVEVEVLDANKEYLFSFGEELWHEAGRDSDGRWEEEKNDYSMKATFPTRGTFYLATKLEGNRLPNVVHLSVGKKPGSALLHFWFGVICLTLGILLNEIANKTIIRILSEGDD